ncbi:hypothetical protein CEUSTIGMA_g1084.t1 [Chlamydomonas eustigma]|uniref:Uncharacterized protein n=1 Tax=Chlamydomonas eustigma TaxID=1157962 RepID=A0A250WS38_9CHLO|nr:hypothetical protein CEUSTIGMA_g1084.t1 [Chlamydomonas eustigma]|eukprot:GAX73633.1 hypothetical protein CEUSTIGMA_g1084.t1 [Chlamydomonas eustigma]
MIRQLSKFLPFSLRASSYSEQSLRAFKAVADVEIDFNNRETLKKYVGVRDHLSREPGTKGKFIEALLELKEAVGVLPVSADYRRALEATVAYRLKVCEQNEADAAVEEVLDAHLEELIKECKEEIRLIPLIQSNKPWDVTPEYTVPVYDYVDAAATLNPPPPPPPPK